MGALDNDTRIEAKGAPELHAYERATRRWLVEVVIGLGLCPFAREPFEAGRVDIVVTPARSPDALVDDLVYEMKRLAESSRTQLETTLLVHPFVLRGFDDYNDFLDVAERASHDCGFDGVLQVASFHPDYRFAGARSDDVAHATNRSPYPTLHLLREASISEAVDMHPDPASIPERNIATLRAMGREQVDELLRGLVEPASSKPR